MKELGRAQINNSLFTPTAPVQIRHQAHLAKSKFLAAQQKLDQLHARGGDFAVAELCYPKLCS